MIYCNKFYFKNNVFEFYGKEKRLIWIDREKLKYKVSLKYDSEGDIDFELEGENLIRISNQFRTNSGVYLLNAFNGTVRTVVDIEKFQGLIYLFESGNPQSYFVLAGSVDTSIKGKLLHCTGNKIQVIVKDLSIKKSILAIELKQCLIILVLTRVIRAVLPTIISFIYNILQILDSRICLNDV